MDKIKLYEFIQIREEKRKIQEKIDYIVACVLMNAHLIEEYTQKQQYSVQILKLNTQMKDILKKEEAVLSQFSKDIDFSEFALSLLEKK